MKKPILISSFYNEEYMLPWWCEHHKKMFDHAILFNYFSTDKSVEIIKSICPHWEIRDTANKDWHFSGNDKEFMRTERELDGYKIVLTTTEFLVGNYPDLLKEKSYFGVPLKRVIDIEPSKKPTYDIPLVSQKNIFYKVSKDKYKRRFLHNYPDGNYHVGRHSSGYKHKDIPMQIYKYVFAPWTEEFIQRKLSMKQFMNSNDILKGRGSHHKWNREKLIDEYNKSLNKVMKNYGT